MNDSITTRGEGGVLNKRHNLGYTVYYNPVTNDFLPVEDYDKELAKSSNDLDEVYFGNNELISKGYVAIRPPEVRGKLGCWTWSIDKFREEIDSLVVTGKVDSYTVKKRTFVNFEDITQIGNKLVYRYFSEGNSRSIIDFSTNDGTTTLNDLMDFQGSFDNPKNVDMLEYLIGLIPNDDFTVLDFFSGSCSTAHAVMQLNAEDGGNRKFIMVQLPEKIDEKSEAFKAGFKNICEIGKERIRRAGAKLVPAPQPPKGTAPQPPKGGAGSESLSLFGTDEGGTEHETQKNSELRTQNSKLDIGFRVYRLDTSNMQDVYYRPQDYKQDMMTELFANHIKPDRTADDLVAQVMLDWGLPLSLPIDQTTIAGKTVYKVAGNALYCCFDEGIDEGFVRALVETGHAPSNDETPHATSLPLRIVFHDYAFADDTAKENVRQLLKQLSGETEMRVV